LARLSEREREVLEQVLQGRLNKQIAFELGIAEKTVKAHRGRVMEKMEAHTVAELVHLCDIVGIELPQSVV
jgi:FixJ family two-component response regulator